MSTTVGTYEALWFLSVSRSLWSDIMGEIADAHIKTDASHLSTIQREERSNALDSSVAERKQVSRYDLARVRSKKDCLADSWPTSTFPYNVEE